MSLKKTLGAIGALNQFVIADIMLYRIGSFEAFKIFIIVQVMFVAALLGLKQLTGLIEILKLKYAGVKNEK